MLQVEHEGQVIPVPLEIERQGHEAVMAYVARQAAPLAEEPAPAPTRTKKGAS